MHAPSLGDLAAVPTRGCDAGTLARATAAEPIDSDVSAPLPVERLTGIDAARGIAMILVCLSHIRHHFEDVPQIYALLTYVTRIATPTFLLLSGFVAAHVLSNRRPGARIAVVDRALCVLIVGHLLLNIEQLPQVGLDAWLFSRVTMTDAIGVSLLVAALCVRLQARWLFLAGLILALGSWPIALLASTDSPLGHHLLVLLFDVHSDQSNLVDAAIAPYLGVFLIGMALSKNAAGLIANRQHAALARRLLGIGAAAIGSMLLAAFLWHELKGMALQLLASPDAVVWIRQTLNPMQKLPPSPAYLVLYGGLGLAIAALCLAKRPRVVIEPVIQWAATIGRASLMVFVAQDWLLRGAPVLLGFDRWSSSLFWIGYLVVVVVLLRWAAQRWDSARANRFLTVGLKAADRRRRAATYPSAPIESAHGLK